MVDPRVSTIGGRPKGGRCSLLGKPVVAALINEEVDLVFAGMKAIARLASILFT
jgi:hypothetical protein